MSFEQLDALRPISALDFLANPPAPRALLLEPWLRERDAAMLFAATGAGKSQVAMSIALAVAGGLEVLEWKASAPRPVLFVDGEMDRGDLQERITALARAATPAAGADAFGRLFLLARDTYRPDVPFPDLGTDEGHEKVLAFAEEVGAALVILDNLSTLATVDDENSASAVKKPIELVQKLRQIGCATLLVHHSDKSGNAYRGSSNLATPFAWVMGLHPSKDAQPGGMDVTLEWHKTRGRTSVALTPRRLRLVETAIGHSEWEVSEPGSFKAVQLARAIRSRQFISIPEAGESIGLKRSQAFEVAKRLPSEAGMSKAEREQCFHEARELREESETAGEPEDF